MAKAYPDTEPFVQAAEKALRKYRPNWGWDLLHLSELLLFFAQDGYASAWQALEEKYREIYAAMLTRKRRPPLVFDELADLERLGLVLTTDRWAFRRIAGDFGRLYREKRYMLDGDFAWFFAAKGEKYRKTMENAAKKDENIACFMQREQANINAREEQRTSFPNNLSGLYLSRRQITNADEETVEQYAAAYREQAHPELRAAALKVFSCRPYPGDPHVIIEDTQSDCAQLQHAAWQALELIRHPVVRTFAINNARSGMRTPENYALLVTNYTPNDAKMLEALLLEQIDAKAWDYVHAAEIDIFRAFYKDSGIPHPKHLLPILYEYTPCSYCRESALEYMSVHRMLTKAILEECLFDSNDDIRRMAAKRLK